MDLLEDLSMKNGHVKLTWTIYWRAKMREVSRLSSGDQETEKKRKDKQSHFCLGSIEL
jgi:hypothetical protein